MKPVEFDSESLLFSWHLLKSLDDELSIMNKRFGSLFKQRRRGMFLHSFFLLELKLMKLCELCFLVTTSFLGTRF
ncbi:unnamed protein product [Amaranthus hypochondriacus]